VVAMALSLDCPRCVLSKICGFLGVGELCSLDAMSKDMFVGLCSPGDKPNVWLQVAFAEGIILEGVDKVSIKSVLGAITSKHISHRPQTLLVHSHQGAEELSKAVQQMQYLRTRHLKGGGRIADAFVAQFFFSPEAVELYVADPGRPVSSLPIKMAMAGTAMKVVLTWREGTIWLSMRQIDAMDRPFQSFAVDLRTVSSPLTMRKDFAVCCAFNERRFRGHGLCCMMGSPSAFAENMRGGILCAGLVHDECARPRSGLGLLSALQLELPALGRVQTQSSASTDMESDMDTGMETETETDTESEYETSDSDSELSIQNAGFPPVIGLMALPSPAST